MRIKKEYFVYKEKDGDYYWEGPNREKLRFCGRPKFIIQSLIKLYGIREAQDIFDKFMAGISTIPDVEIDGQKFKAASFVLYKRENNKDDFKEFGGECTKEVQSSKEEFSSYGEDSLT